MEVKSIPRLQASDIDPRAFEIVQKLQSKGHKSFLVGGCVRDLLLGISPKDFDIATSATPQEVRRAVPSSYLIGRRFKLVLAKRGVDQFEIATFRQGAPSPNNELEQELSETQEEQEEAKFIDDDNYFGTPEQDAVRRDFTVNALFYDPIKNELIDFVRAQQDLEDRILRIIGAPERRIVEDPIRSLRAIRLSHKIGFTIEASLKKAIQSYAPAVALTALPRRREEYLKIFKLENPLLPLFELYDLGLVQTCLPSLCPLFGSVYGQNLLRYHFQSFQDKKEQGEADPRFIFLPIALAIRDFYSEKDLDWIDWVLRTELGAFKNETLFITSILDAQNKLPKIDSFVKRSRKRQLNLLKMPGFDFIYRAIIYDYQLSDFDLMRWENVLLMLSQPEVLKPMPTETQEPSTEVVTEF